MKFLIGLFIFLLIFLIELLALLVLPSSNYTDRSTLISFFLIAVALLFSWFFYKKIMKKEISYSHTRAIILIFLILIIGNGIYITVYIIGEKANILESAIKKSKEIEIRKK